MSFDKDYCDALSLTRLRRELPPGGSLFMFIYDLSFFLTSTAFVSTNTKIRPFTFRKLRHLGKR